MEVRNAEAGRIRRYLLGTLDGEGTELVERRLLADEEFLDEVSAAENELVSDYLAGALPAGEKEQFLNYFLSTPARRRKLRFFGALRRAVREAPAGAGERSRPREKSPAPLTRAGWPRLKLAFAAITLLLVSGASAVLIRNWRGEPAGVGRPAAATFTLSHGGTREAGGLTRVPVPEGAAAVELLLPLAGGDHAAYRAVLVNDTGEVRFTSDELRAENVSDQRVVSVRIPVGVLTRGDYRLKLDAVRADGVVEGVATYPFRVSGR